MGLLREVSPGSATFVPTTRGDSKRALTASPRQGFVVVRRLDLECLRPRPGIEDAGYEARRIDEKEHDDKDEIIAEIGRSRFAVADFACSTVPREGKEVAIPRDGYEADLAQASP